MQYIDQYHVSQMTLYIEQERLLNSKIKYLFIVCMILIYAGYLLPEMERVNGRSSCIILSCIWKIQFFDTLR